MVASGGETTATQAGNALDAHIEQDHDAADVVDYETDCGAGPHDVWHREHELTGFARYKGC